MKLSIDVNDIINTLQSHVNIVKDHFTDIGFDDFVYNYWHDCLMLMEVMKDLTGITFTVDHWNVIAKHNPEA